MVEASHEINITVRLPVAENVAINLHRALNRLFFVDSHHSHREAKQGWLEWNMK
jgi:hypothetical protein